jgi:hypothetical protein
MCKINSRSKGKVGELEASKVWAKLFGCEARRGQQFSGSPDSPDVVCDIPGVHLEVKRTERFDLYGAIAQAANDAGENVPIVLHRANGKPWVAVIELYRLPEAVVKLYLNAASQK